MALILSGKPPKKPVDRYELYLLPNVGKKDYFTTEGNAIYTSPEFQTGKTINMRKKENHVGTLPPNSKITVTNAPDYNSAIKDGTNDVFVLFECGKKKGLISTRYITKPSGKSVASNVTATTFLPQSKQNRTVYVMYKGEKVRCIEFTSSKEIKDNVIEGVKNNPNTFGTLCDYIQDFFAPTCDFSDAKDALKDSLDKIGVYLGELLIGWVILEGIAGKAIRGNSSLKNIDGKHSRFYMPVDKAFKGVDSFVIEETNGIKRVYGISSKFGSGAKASFIANVLPYIDAAELGKSGHETLRTLKKVFDTKQPNEKDLELIYRASSILFLNDKNRECGNRMLEDARNYQGSIKKIGSKDYEIDMSERQKISSSKPLSDYSKKYRPLVLSIAKNHNSIFDKVEQLYPTSISSLFCRELSRRLEEESLELLKNIIRGKDFIQVNLNKTSFNNGKILFDVVEKQITLKIVGNKGGIADANLSNGRINYELS